jgi:nucleoid-associated protein YgaU
MAVNEKKEEEQALGPSVVLGLVGAVVVLLLLGAGIWGVGKIISKIRESKEDEEEVAETTEGTETSETKEETKTEETTEGEVNGDAVTDEQEEQGESQETTEEQAEETTEGEASTQEENKGGLANAIWIANNYIKGDVNGDAYTVVWGDTLWEISEGRYGSGFEWGKIKEANLDKIGYLPNGSRALIFPGQVLRLP